MRRYVPLLIAGSALIAAACRDVTSPSNEATTDLSYLGDRSYVLAISPGEGGDAQTTTFTIKAGGNVAKVGEFTLTFDANAVCDPATSGYGPTFWKQSCTPLGRDMQITARTFTANGNSYVEFSPDIRFNPAVNVTASVTRPEIVGRKLTHGLVVKYGIWYTKTVGKSRLFVDEAASDPELQTHMDTSTGLVWREIRHFSGIVIHVGRSEIDFEL